MHSGQETGGVSNVLPSPDVRGTVLPVFYLLGTAHAALFAFDLVFSAGFLRADRAEQRALAIQRLLEAFPDRGRMLDAIAGQGIFFDYGFHALAIALSGRMGLIAAQIVLGIVGACCVSYIALRTFNSRRLAIAAGILYGLLPQSLAFPHQLLTESIANPMLIIAVALFIRALDEPRRQACWWLAGLAFGIAGAVRPALCLLPLAACTVLAWVRWRAVPAWNVSAFFAGSFVLLIAWCFFMWVQVGRFGLGESGQDLGLNFADSVAKVLLREGVGPADGTRPEWLPERLSVSEYLTYMREYPLGFANLYSMNVFVMTSDSGIGRLYVDLLGLGAEARLALQDPVNGWRAQLTNHGLMAMFRQGLAVAPGTIVAGTVGAVAFAFVNLGVLAAYVALLSNAGLWARRTGGRLVQRWGVAFLLLTPLYVIVTSQVVAYAPSRHRSQGEFAWAILACLGWTLLWQWRSRRALLERLLGSNGDGSR